MKFVTAMMSACRLVTLIAAVYGGSAVAASADRFSLWKWCCLRGAGQDRITPKRCGPVAITPLN